jgi:ABC-type glycerol-3-phosphate transport system permease component
MESFKPNIELFTSELSILPRNFSFEHYREVFILTNFFTYLKNSLIATFLTIILSNLIAIFSSYAISRFKFRGKNILRHSILFAYMMPGIVLAIPLYLMFKGTILFNTIFSLVISYLAFTLPFSVWFLTAYIDSLPIEIEEAALIDGAGRTTILLRIVLPLMLPGIVASSVYNFIVAWNDFTFANILITIDNVKTLPVGMSLFMEQTQVNWGALFATSSLATIPSIIFLITSQKGLIKGLAAGAVKR